MIDAVKAIGKTIPGAPEAYRLVRSVWRGRLRRRSAETVFTDIYRRRAWPGTESVSGPGAEFAQTRTLSAALPRLLLELRVSTVLDLPCGDFHWMSSVDLGGASYVGADIVEDLVASNAQRYTKPGIEFRRLDLLKDPFPDADLLICRDCLVHLSFRDVARAFRNIARSRCTYLLTTTFTERTTNVDIETGNWRTLNLRLAPFQLPAPLRTLNEQCTELGGAYSDKALALWEVEGIREAIERM
jgi:SAM-dependent methyltransferase